MKKKLRLIIILIVIIGFFGFLYLDATKFSLNRVKTNYDVIESKKIDKSLDGLQIAFISDIYYNGYMDEQRFENVVENINKANPDIVIFLGDLFDNPSGNIPDEKTINTITKQLSSINAQYGKFAVYGEQDLIDDATKTTVGNILYNSDFEVIQNQSLSIAYNGDNTFNLIGLDPMINGHVDSAQAFSGIDVSKLNIVITHTPDTFDNLDTKLMDLGVGGHSLGGQLYFPIFGPLLKLDGALKYNRGTYHVNNSTLRVTNGIGTRDLDARLFTDSEILIYTLKKEQ